MKKKFYTVLVVCTSFAMKANHDPTGGWLMYFGNASFQNTKIKASYDVQFRNHELTTDLNQLLIRGSIQYPVLENLTVGTGYAFVLTEKIGEPNLPFNENRIYQDVLTNQKLGSSSFLKHRFRFEQRFIDHQDFKTRMRYQLGIDIPVYKNNEKKRSAYATAYNEVFMNTDKTTRKLNAFDRNRLFIGAGYKWNKDLAIQLGWMNQMLQKQSNQQIMVSFHQNIQL